MPLRGRRVRRILRSVDPWSVLRFSIVFYACVDAVLVVARLVLWIAARSLGVIDNVEHFVESAFALHSFRFKAAQLLRASVIGGAVLVVLVTGVNVVGA